MERSLLLSLSLPKIGGAVTSSYNWWNGMFSLASLEAIVGPVYLLSLPFFSLSIRSRQLVDSSPFLASWFARGNWWSSLPF